MTEGLAPYAVDQFVDFLTLEQGAAALTHEAYARDITRFATFALVKGVHAPADVVPKLLREYV